LEFELGKENQKWGNSDEPESAHALAALVLFNGQIARSVVQWVHHPPARSPCPLQARRRGQRRFADCSRTARSTGQALPRLGLPTRQQSGYGGSLQGCGNGEEEAADAAVVLQWWQTLVLFGGDSEVLITGGWRGVRWRPQIRERLSAGGSHHEGRLVTVAWRSLATRGALRWVGWTNGVVEGRGRGGGARSRTGRHGTEERRMGAQGGSFRPMRWWERKGGGGPVVRWRRATGGGRGGLAGGTWSVATRRRRQVPVADRDVGATGAGGSLRPVEQGRWTAMGRCSGPSQKE
jgi:hypothetical protein